MAHLGIDIGGSSVKLALLDPWARQTLATGQSMRYHRPTTPQLIAAIKQAASEMHLPQSVTAAGLCVPGLLDLQRRIITLATNVPGLMNVPLDALIADSLPQTKIDRIQIVNDAVATGIDIVTSRQLIGRSLVIAMGTGIGAAVFDRPELDAEPVSLRVEGESPGHIGQIDVSLSDDAPVGSDGGSGSLEAYCGAGALRARFAGLDNTSIAFHQIQPDDIALQALARAIRISHAMYRPSHIVLAGGVGIRLSHLIEPLRERVLRHLTSVAQADWTLTVADDDFHAARGSARLAAAMAR